MTRDDRIQRLVAAIPELTDYRLQLIDRIVGALSQTKDFRRSAVSDLVSKNVLGDFGDVLRLHHIFSRESFSKDKFEYALEKVLLTSGIQAALCPKGQRGFDIQISGGNFSLKTEAARAIRLDVIHISKFMELGSGQWGNRLTDLNGLRGQFLDALSRIQRILILRALRKGDPQYVYELVEIPKKLLERAATGRLKMMFDSTQNPKPGYCYVEDNEGPLFNLYFDGGGERKLQIKGLLKRLCIVHATWTFDSLKDNF